MTASLESAQAMSGRGRARRGGQFARLAALLLAAFGVAGCASTSPYARGRSAAQAGDARTAIAEFDAAIAAGSHVVDATRERGGAKLAAGDIDGALADLTAAQGMGDRSARLQWLLGSAFSKAGRPAEAAQAYRAYESMARSGSAREQVRMRVAQLDAEVTVAAASALRDGLAAGNAPPQNSVAVYAFQPAAGKDASLEDQKMCRALNVMVAADLAKVSALTTLAADQLEVLYAEQRYTYDNRQFFEPASLVAAGSLLPARHMVRGLYGTVEDRRIVMGAACYDAQTQTGASCSEHDGPAADLFDMETQLVLDVLNALGVKPLPAELEAIGRKPTRNLRAFLAFGEGLYLRETGDLKGAEHSFEKAAALDPGFTLAVEAGAAAAVEASGAEAALDVPPPPAASASGERAMTSSLHLGLGLIPELDSGDATAAHTEDVVVVRGEATLRITATIENGRGKR